MFYTNNVIPPVRDPQMAQLQQFAVPPIVSYQQSRHSRLHPAVRHQSDDDATGPFVGVASRSRRDSVLDLLRHRTSRAMDLHAAVPLVIVGPSHFLSQSNPFSFVHHHSHSSRECQISIKLRVRCDRTWASCVTCESMRLSSTSITRQSMLQKIFQQ